MNDSLCEGEGDATTTTTTMNNHQEQQQKPTSDSRDNVNVMTNMPMAMFNHFESTNNTSEFFPTLPTGIHNNNNNNNTKQSMAQEYNHHPHVVEFSDGLWQHHPANTTEQPLTQVKQEQQQFNFIPSEYYPSLDYQEQGPPPEQPQIQHRRSLPTHVMPNNTTTISKQRRYTEGEFLPPQPTIQGDTLMGEDEEQRRKNFLERNRQAALKCRQRKKQWLADLQNQVEYLNTDNKQLEIQVTALREEILNLKTLIIAHKDCPVARRNSSNIYHVDNSQETQMSSSGNNGTTNDTIHQHHHSSSHFLPTTPTSSFYYH